MAEEVIKDIEERLAKHFLDVIVLHELRSSNRLTGYDVMTIIYTKFDILISSGTIYSLLYSLERKGLIEGGANDGKRTYVLTDQGVKTINAIEGSTERILRFMQTLVKG